MKLVLLLTGKTDQAWIRDGVAEYEKRILKICRPRDRNPAPMSNKPGNRRLNGLSPVKPKRCSLSSELRITLLLDGGAGTIQHWKWRGGFAKR
jgi:hypothetical protein